MDHHILEMRAKFEELFDCSKDARLFFSPGRVNLIGEHTDYNGGHVFPCALEIGTYALVSKREDRELRFYSLNEAKAGLIQTDLDHADHYDPALGWVNYVMGMIHVFEKHGYTIPSGWNMVVYGNIPVASGLSSSASLEILIGYILKTLFGFEVSGTDLALMGQEDENKYIGLNCGIMDQFVIANGKKDHALFLDTATLEYKTVPFVLKGRTLVIMNTNKPRGLKDSKYNERRAECEKALKILQSRLNIKTLGDLTDEEFDANADLLKGDVIYKRAKHAVYENTRTIKAVEVLRKNDIEAFGKLMDASHDSLRYDYEVTGAELDALVDAARSVKGTIGSRMTGAGFGGCAIAIVEDEALEEFKKTVREEYIQKIGYEPSFYEAVVGDGPKEIKE
ncbi:MAG: galactokinase [Erysipelotrichales bacterium]|nr:galactokinase [Erysipelotrichales bacterium]MBQ5542414.1 galactokinase [Erysipelotrichales bacterium]